MVDYIEDSKEKWSKQADITDLSQQEFSDSIKIGCLQRIASSLEEINLELENINLRQNRKEVRDGIINGYAELYKLRWGRDFYLRGLRLNNINTVGELIEYSLPELKKMSNIGKKSIRTILEIEKKLSKYGVHLRKELSDGREKNN